MLRCHPGNFAFHGGLKIMPEPINKNDVRWIQRFQNFKKAFRPLSDAVKLAQERDLTELEQQGLIKAFEFTHELAWNTLKDYLEEQGYNGVIGSKNATREAFAANLIENGSVWMEMIDNRNKSTHTYNCTLAHAMAEAIIGSYFSEFAKFQKKFTELEQREQ